MSSSCSARRRDRSPRVTPARHGQCWMPRWPSSPAGNVPVMLCDGTLASVELEAFYLDRFAVTNRQFQRFVQAGGYDDLEIWPQEVWPSVTRFTDRTGPPGPAGLGERQVPRRQGRAPGRRRLLVRGRGLRPLGRQAAAHRRRVAEGRRLARAAQRRDLQPLPLGRHVRPGADEPLGLGRGPDRPRPRVPVRRHPQRHLPDDRQRLGVARRPARDHPLPSRRVLPGRGSPCAGSSAGPSTPISRARPPASSSPARASSTAARTSDSAAPCRSRRYVPCRERIVGSANDAKHPWDSQSPSEDQPCRVDHTFRNTTASRAITAARSAAGTSTRASRAAIASSPTKVIESIRSAPACRRSSSVVLGPTGVGKTVYLGMLLDLLARGVGGLHGLARSPFSLTLHRNLILALERQRFPEKTPVESDRWHWVHCEVITPKSKGGVRHRDPRRRGRGGDGEMENPRHEQDHPRPHRPCAGLVVLVDLVQVVADGQGQELFAMQLISYLDSLRPGRKKSRQGRGAGRHRLHQGRPVRGMDRRPGGVRAGQRLGALRAVPGAAGTVPLLLLGRRRARRRS